MPVDPPEWAVVGFPARGSVAPTPSSKSLGRWWCGWCFNGLDRANVLASSVAPVPGTAGPGAGLAAAKQVTTPILGLRTPEPAGGSASGGPGCGWADALLHWHRLPTVAAGVGPPTDHTATTAWAENTQSCIWQCPQWPGGGSGFSYNLTVVFGRRLLAETLGAVRRQCLQRHRSRRRPDSRLCRRPPGFGRRPRAKNALAPIRGLETVIFCTDSRLWVSIRVTSMQLLRNVLIAVHDSDFKLTACLLFRFRVGMVSPVRLVSMAGVK